MELPLVSSIRNQLTAIYLNGVPVELIMSGNNLEIVPPSEFL